MSSPGADRRLDTVRRVVGSLASIALLLGVVWIPSRPAPAQAAEVASASFVLVREGDVVGEDLYVAGERVEIRGTVEGDLVVSAFDVLVVSGTVTGDVVGTGRTVRIEGQVGGSVRLLAGRVRIDGTVEEDVAVAGGPVVVAGTVGRDLLVYTTELHVPGAVARDILGRAYVEATIGGTIGNDVRIDTGRLVVREGAMVGGSVDYRSARAARVDGEVGAVHRLRDRPGPVGVRGAWLLVGGIYLVLLYLFGLLIVGLAPRLVERAARRTWWPPLVAPVVAVVALSLPIAIGAAFVSLGSLDARLSIPATVLGTPFVLMAAGIVAAAATFALVPVAVAVGRVLLSARRSAFAHLTVGFLVVLAAGAIPIVGPLLLGLAWLAGTGAWFLAAGGRRAGTHEAASVGAAPEAEAPSDVRAPTIEAVAPGMAEDTGEPVEGGGRSLDGGTEDPGPQAADDR